MIPLRGMLAAALFATLSLAAAAAQAREMVSIARAEANIRAGAGTQHDALWRVTQGYPLEVIGRRGNWLRVRDFENDRGWVYRPLTASQPHHVVTAKVLNLRSAPGERARVVAKASYGDVLRTLGKKGQWVRVRDADGRVGWVAKRHVWGW